MKDHLAMADFTAPGLIVPRLRSGQTEGVVEELAAVLCAEGRIPDARTFGQLVLRRETVATTALASEVALPHARLAGLNRPWFAFGRSENPVTWGGRAIHCVFLMAVPESETAGYLILLSGLARSGLEGRLPKLLRAARDTDQILEIFRGIPLAHPRAQAIGAGS